MSSIIHYKFRSAKEFDSYHFEGAGIPVWQLKVEIIENKKLEKSTDFDLVISNAQTNVDYTDDSQIISRNTSVVVRRVPVAPGTGKIYPARQPKPLLRPTASSSTTINTTSQGTGPLSTGDSDVQKMIHQSSARFDQLAWANAATSAQHQHTHGRKQMTFRPKPTSTLLQQPPANYVCFRCGEKGHYIQQCPTNLDPTYDKPRIKKTTGIPKSFLKPVEGNVIDARAADPTLSLMVTAEGQTVVNQPNENEWKRLIETRTLSSELVEVEEEPQDGENADTSKNARCPNNHLLVNPVLLPCCGVKYCEGCVQKLQVCGRCRTSIADHSQMPATDQSNKRDILNEKDVNKRGSVEDAGRDLGRQPPPHKGSPDMTSKPRSYEGTDSYLPSQQYVTSHSDRKESRQRNGDREYHHDNHHYGERRRPREDQFHSNRTGRSRSPERRHRRRRSRSKSPPRHHDQYHHPRVSRH